MIQLHDRIRACKCQKHNKLYCFIHTAENCQDKLRGMCDRCVKLELTRELFNIDNLFEFLKAEQNDEDALINTYKASIWQQFKLTQIQIIELLEQLEIKLEAFLDDICGNTILTKIKEQYFDKVIKEADVEKFGQLLGNYIEIDKEGKYQQKEQLKIEQQDSYIKSIQINQVQDQAKSILRQLALQYTHIEEMIQIETIQTIKLGGACKSVCFNHNETQIAIAVGTSIYILNFTNGGLQIQDSNQLIGHDEQIYQIRFNHDSTQIVSSDHNGLIIIWIKQNDGTWIIQEKLKEHTDPVKTICFNHDSKLLATTSGDNKIYIWNYSMQKWKLIQTLNGHTKSVFGLCFNNDSTLLASTSDDMTVIIWALDVDQKWVAQQTLISHTDSVLGVLFNAKSNQLVTHSNDKTIKLWSLNNNSEWKCNHTLNGHTDIVLSVNFSKLSDMILSSSQDNSIKIWRTNSSNQWECQQTIQQHQSIINCVIINSNTSMIVSVSDDQLLMVHNLQPEPPQRSLTANGSISKLNTEYFECEITNNHQIQSLESLLSGKVIVEDNEQQQLPYGINLTQQVFNIQSTQTLNVQESVILSNKIDSTDVDVTMDTGSMIDQVQGIQSFVPQDFSYSTGQRIKLKHICNYLCFNHNESQIAAAFLKSIILFNLSQDGIWVQDKQSLTGHTNCIQQVKFNHNSTQIASCSNDNLVIIWCKQQNGQWSIQQRLNEHTDYVKTICYNHDSTLLASGSSDMSIIIYHLNNDKWQLKQKLSQHTKFVYDVCFNHDSTLLASGSYDNSIILWECDNVGNWIVKSKLTGHTDLVRSVSFNSQSSCLISGSDDNTIKIWSVDNYNWKCTETLTGHTNWVLSACFNKESNMISSGGEDGQIKIWNINNEKQWECTQTINEHTNWVNVIINSDSSMMISGSDYTILIHNRISKKQSSTQILQSPDIKVTANMIQQQNNNSES